jgi:heme exporter protein CcmD
MLMNHWAFIWPAYGLTLVATFGLLAHSLLALRSAESRARNAGDEN